MWKIIFVALWLGVSCTTFCPRVCDCDLDNGLYRATCDNQNLANIDVGVSRAVQIYSLSRNSISEVNNYCFQQMGYRSLRILDLSQNVIEWVYGHSFFGLDELYQLHLSNNRLRGLPPDVFLDTPRLDILDLSSNIFESLKNRPFIIHDRLQVLNLNNCRIQFLPDLLFKKLPNLKKLDLSDNYFVTFNVDILKPLNHLDRIELKSEYISCSRDFVAVETYIAAREITYRKQCMTKLPKISEKMISMVPSTERQPVDIDKVWNIAAEKKNSSPVLEQKKSLTPFEKFDKDFSASQAFIIGVELGLAVGVVGTYVWLRRFCSCGQLSCVPPRRRPRSNRVDEVRSNLLRSNTVNVDMETPPIFRREMLREALPLRREVPSAPVYEPTGPRPPRDPPSMADVIRSRPETPPPPYSECRLQPSGVRLGFSTPVSQNPRIP